MNTSDIPKDFGYIFDFGKYKGETVEYVGYLDPSYISWCIEKFDWFYTQLVLV